MRPQDLEQFRQSAYWRELLQGLSADPVAIFSTVSFVLLLCLIFFGALLAPYGADDVFIGLEKLAPSWGEMGQIRHFFGTDAFGHDIFSRILYGFYYTAGSALLITLAIGLLGGLIGVLSGTKKSRSFWLLSHLFDTFLFTPILLIAIIIATLMEASLLNAMLAIFLAMLPHFIHKIFQASQQVFEKEYVQTLRLEGASRWYLIREAILPSLTPLAVKELSHIFVIAVLDISALSFISLGAKSPTPEWGAMIHDGLAMLESAPWAVILPGLAIIGVILIVTLFGNCVVRVLERQRYKE